VVSLLHVSLSSSHVIVHPDFASHGVRRFEFATVSIAIEAQFTLVSDDIHTILVVGEVSSCVWNACPARLDEPDDVVSGVSDITKMKVNANITEPVNSAMSYAFG
jgi:hypothetical protein